MESRIITVFRERWNFFLQKGFNLKLSYIYQKIIETKNWITNQRCINIVYTEL